MRPRIHDSTEKGPRLRRGGPSRDKRNPHLRSVALGPRVLNFSNAIAAGDYVMRQIVKREEFRAQHGPVRVLVKNGKPVEAP